MNLTTGESEMTTTGTEAAAGEREIVLERTFDASRERVFDAWTDPAHLARWFGPRGFTTTTHEADIREGGVWRYTMHAPDGTDYPNRMRYLEITRPERIVYDHDDDGHGDPAPFHVVVTFEEEGGRTRQVSRMRFATAEERDAKVRFGAIELGHQTMDRLAALVEGRSSGD
jgi:uncharacterized protein YndB with AHSA1/START domain